MHKLLLATLTLSLALSAHAQTQLVRGKVEDVPSTNRFVLDCTPIPLISTTLNLNLLVGQQWNLQVVNTGTPTQPVLDVRSATAATKIMDMGNLRFGRSERWEVNYAPGSVGAVFVQLSGLTSYLPAGAPGTWLLGLNSLHLATGVTNGAGQFQFNLTMPTIPSLVGVSFTSQALVKTPANDLVVSNPDCKVVRND